MTRSVEPFVGVVERESDIDRGPPDQQPVRVDEAGSSERRVIGLQTASDDARQKRRTVQCPGGRAKDEIEAFE
jgi:hypothetical protein